MAVILNFHPVSLSDSVIVRKYMEKSGEGSCQHSFVSMISLFEKYGDSVCESDEVLYTLRSHLCSDKYRYYLAPMFYSESEKQDNDIAASAFSNIIEDAHSHGCKTMFHTLTEKNKDILESVLPGKFLIEERRDLAEYIYSTEKMAAFAGHDLSEKRREANKLRRIYGERLNVSVIKPDDFDDILRFEKKWLSENAEDHDMNALYKEEKVIEFQLEHYSELALSGIVIRIDGEICGFNYGAALNSDYYDTLIEKGDKNIEDIYRLLIQESVIRTMGSFRFLNREEDLGIPGLRKSKLSYSPVLLLKKYEAAEI